MRKNIIKINIIGIVAGITASTTFFSAAASTESSAELTKEYDNLQKMFLSVDKDTTEDALYYNYGTYWDFSEDEPGNVYSGYYYYKPGDTKGGITMKYSNGNTKDTGYHSVDSAEDALIHIL